MQDDFNDLHRIVLNFLNLPLGMFIGLFSLVLFLSYHSIAVLKLVFLEVVVKIAK